MVGFDEIAIPPDGRTREGKAFRKALDVTSVEHKVSDATNVYDKNASLARAEARLKEIRGNGSDMGETRDRFYAPPPPDGFDYQWKMRSVMGEEQNSYIVELSRQGWEAVPLSRHPELMPHGWSGNTIEVDGLVLMERPKVLTDEARAIEARNAREAVMTKEAQLKTGRGSDLGPREVHRFSKSRSPIGVPSDE